MINRNLIIRKCGQLLLHFYERFAYFVKTNTLVYHTTSQCGNGPLKTILCFLWSWSRVAINHLISISYEYDLKDWLGFFSWFKNNFYLPCQSVPVPKYRSLIAHWLMVLSNFYCGKLMHRVIGFVRKVLPCFSSPFYGFQI